MTQRTRLHVRVEFHTAGEHTHLRWLSARPLAESDRFEVPTIAIPADLRRIGSEFYLVLLDVDRASVADTDELRHRIRDSFRIERISLS
jgi:hypothetical protein